MKLFTHFLGEVLYLVNSNKPNRNSYFELKEKIVKKYGTKIGLDVQHVKKICYACHGTGWYEEGIRCYKCQNGIYHEFWTLLSKWQIGNRSFHLIDRRINEQYANDMINVGRIEGLIVNNSSVSYLTSYRAFRFLQFMFDFKRFIKSEFLNFYWKHQINIANFFGGISRFIKQSTCKHFWEDDHDYTCRYCSKINPDYDYDWVPF